MDRREPVSAGLEAKNVRCVPELAFVITPKSPPSARMPNFVLRTIATRFGYRTASWIAVMKGDSLNPYVRWTRRFALVTPT